MRPRRFEILGVPVDCVTMSQALAVVQAMLEGDSGAPEMVIAVNPEKVMKARQDSALLGRLMRAGLLIPDGIGVVFAARCKRLHAPIERVPGSELMPLICERAARSGRRIFLFGASPEVNPRVAAVLRQRYPGISIVGHQHGYVAPEEMPAVIRTINASGADILFVALGSPTQEIWMDRHVPQLNVKVCQGVGGTFDVLAGRVRRAPLLFRKWHLEWLYRLASEPRRLLRQTALPRFAFQVMSRQVMSRVGAAGCQGTKG